MQVKKEIRKARGIFRRVPKDKLMGCQRVGMVTLCEMMIGFGGSLARNEGFWGGGMLRRGMNSGGKPADM